MNLKFLSTLLVLTALMAGCENNDGSTGPGTYSPTDSVWSDGSGGWYVRLNATNSSEYRYFNFTDREVKTVADATTDQSWHIGWSRVSGKLNGGDAGPLEMLGVDLATAVSPADTDFAAITAVPQIADSLWMADAENHVFSPWYIYTGPPNHQILPAHTLFVMKSAGGMFAKVVVDTIIAPTQTTMGTLVLKYVHQANGSGDLSGAVQTAQITDTGSGVFFSLATGGAVTVADPMTSTAWDIWFKDYDARINGGISGPGQAALLPYGPTPIESVTSAPVEAPFFTDHISSVFGSPTVGGSEWYNYFQDQGHLIASKHHVYILKFASGTHFKLQVTDYYLVVNGQAQSGWVTMRFKEF